MIVIAQFLDRTANLAEVVRPVLNCDQVLPGESHRSPEVVILVPTQCRRQSVLRSEHINCASLTVIASENRSARALLGGNAL